MASTQSPKFWPLNLSIGLCIAGMAFLARLLPVFGAMYLGMGDEIPLPTHIAFYPTVYWGIPTVILLATIVQNILRSLHPIGSFRALWVTLILSLFYLLIAGLAVFLPMLQFARMH